MRNDAVKPCPNLYILVVHKYLMNPEIRDGLRRIFNKYDPIGIYFGEDVNFDEYDPEIDDMLTKFKRSKNLEEFTNEVHATFVRFFDEDIAGPKSEYRKLAEEVYGFLNIKYPNIKSENPPE